MPHRVRAAHPDLGERQGGQVPVNLYVSVNLTDSNASYFSPAKLAEQTGVTVEATQTIKGNAAADPPRPRCGTSSPTSTTRPTSCRSSRRRRTMAFDRRTAQLVNCWRQRTSTATRRSKQSGYVGIVLPIGTEKKTYPVFVPDVKKPVPFAYAGVDAVGGTEAYRFRRNIPRPERHPTGARFAGQPERIVGHPAQFFPGADHLLDRPGSTGALLNVTENQKLTLRDSTGAQALLLFDANLVATTDSVDSSWPSTTTS